MNEEKPIEESKARPRRSRSRRRRGPWSRFRASVLGPWYAMHASIDRWLRPHRRRRHHRGTQPKRTWAGWCAAVAVGALSLPFLILRAVARSVARSWKRRRVRHLLRGLPALFAVGLVIATGVLAQRQSLKLGDLYRDQALKAYRAEKWEEAKVYYERLEQLDHGAESTQFDLALTLEHLGEIRRAAAIMERLAHRSPSPFPRAQLWLAIYFLEHESPENRESLRSQAYELLLLARRGLPNEPEVDYRLAEYYARVDRPLDAAAALERCARLRPWLNFELSIVYANLGNTAGARAAAERADVYYRDLVAKEPNNDDARLRWASIRMNLGDFLHTIQILLDGEALHPNGPYRSALAAAYMTQYARTVGTDAASQAQRLEYLRKALQYEPTNEAAMKQLIDYAAENESAETHELLESLLVQGRTNAFVHFTLGVRAWKTGDTKQALTHLQRAYDLDPNLSVVANNLAWVLASSEPPDLERAFALADSVVRKEPDNAQYRDTRGQILMKMERWREALDDLERALPGMPEDTQLHAALATVYEKLGQVSLAEKHRRFAEAR